MKIRWFFFGVLILTATTVFAQDNVQYVFNGSKVMVRKGPGTNNKIVDMLEVSTPVTVLNKGGQWIQVRTPKGVEGYILGRFLTEKVPAAILLADMQDSYETLKQQTVKPLQEIETLTSQNSNLTQAAAEQKAAYEALEQQYKTLSHRSQNVLELQEEYEAVKKQLIETTRQAEALNVERDNLKLSQRIRWFLAGAGVLLLGVAIGYSTKKKRGRASSLY